MMSWYFPKRLWLTSGWLFDGCSEGFTGNLRRGEQKYRCDRGNWVSTGSAGLVYSSNGSPLAKYWSTVDAKKGVPIYFWTIANSAGSHYESGSPNSRLQASPLKTVRVSTSAIPEFLAIVKRRIGGGDAAMVAFVSLTGTKGGLPPRKALCSYTGATAGVPFSGTFRFYTQDLQPPTLPQSLTPRGSFIQAFFLEGKAVYKFVGNRWVYQGMYATIFTVAGGEALGKFGTVTKPDRFSSKVLLKLNDPNGFWTYMQMSARPVRMSLEGCAWQLLRITTSGGWQ